MTFLIFVVVVVLAYLAWRIVDQLPDIVYRLSEIQRDVADLRRQFENGQSAPGEHEASAQAEPPSPEPTETGDRDE